MKIIAQMDDLPSIKISSDTTFVMLLEAQNRGHEIYYYLPENLILNGNKVSAFVHQIKLRDEHGSHYEILKSQLTDLTEFDLILFRQDPPFNIRYITSSYILEKIKDRVLIINNPTEIRNCPEKIFVTNFPELMPPTIITSNLEAIKLFRKKHKDIIIKPLYGGGGDGILHIKPEDDNFTVITGIMDNFYKAPMVVQKYLPEIKDGDKRIFILDGKIISALNRIPISGEARSNLAAGGTAIKTVVTKKEEKICNKIGEELKRRGLIFAGIDMIGGYVTEINITSPTGIRDANKLNGTKLEKIILDCFEEKILGDCRKNDFAKENLCYDQKLTKP